MSDQKHNELWNGGQNKNLSAERLLAYLEGRLSPEEQHEIEEQLADEGAVSDAIEGLQGLGVEITKQAVRNINLQLHTTLLRANKKRKRRSTETYWGWIAVIVILLLVVLGYVVVKVIAK